MNRTPNRLAALVLAAVLVLSAGACSDDGSDGSAGGGSGSGSDATATTAAPSAGEEDTTGGEEDTGGGDEEEAAAGECVEDSDQLSGSSTVVWDDGDVSPELTMTFGDDGSLSPSSLTVPVGERFGVDHGPGTDIRVVKIGCAGGQTLPGGVTAGFVIDTPGTYVIVDESADGYAGAEVGSVTVE